MLLAKMLVWQPRSEIRGIFQIGEINRQPCPGFFLGTGYIYEASGCYKVLS